MVHSSKRDALSDADFERLVEATDDLRAPFDREALIILICAGRLGMRAGEICHMRREWINWDRGLVEIPMHEPCDCGYCKSCAHQSMKKSGVDEKQDFAERWKPKTPTSARSIPFDFSDRVAATIELFFEEFDEYPHSRVSLTSSTPSRAWNPRMGLGLRRRSRLVPTRTRREPAAYRGNSRLIPSMGCGPVKQAPSAAVSSPSVCSLGRHLTAAVAFSGLTSRRLTLALARETPYRSTSASRRRYALALSINRRVDRVAEAAGIPTEKVYPHCLRATAATHHAYRGLPPVALQSMLGWSQLAVARHYIKSSGGATRKALLDVHED